MKINVFSGSLIAKAAGILVTTYSVLGAFGAQADYYMSASNCEAVGSPANLRVSAIGTIYNSSTTNTQTVSCPLAAFDSAAIFLDVYLTKRTTGTATCYLVSRRKNGTAGYTIPMSVSGTGYQRLNWDYEPSSIGNVFTSVRCDLPKAASSSGTNELHGLWYMLGGS